MSQLALRCTLAGRIQTILRDDAGIFALRAARAAGAMLGHAIVESGQGHVSELLAQVEDHGVVCEWVLELEQYGEIVPYTCAAAAEGDVVLIVGSDDELAAGDATALCRGAEPMLALLAERIDQRLGHSSALMDDLRRQVSALQAQLISPIRLENELLRVAAHDLRNPMLVVSMNCSYLLGDSANLANLSDEQRTVLAECMQATELVGRILDGMTSLSELWVGRMQLRRVRTDLGQLVRRLVERYALIARAQQIHIEAAEIAEVSMILDALKIELAVAQLLANVVAHCPRGTRARVAVEHVVGHRGQHDAGQGGRHAAEPAGSHRAGMGEICIRVTDDGPGIAPDIRKIAFRPFGKPRPEDPGREHTAGVGLPIAKRIVEAHGGHIELGSTPGSGTQAVIFLPAAGLEDSQL